MNTIIARSGSVSDAAVLEKVDQEPAIYKKPEN